MVSTWQDIDAVLSPVIGQRGVAMLYKRSLYLIGPVHPWLAGMHEGVQATIDLEALKSAFAQQSSANAAAAGITVVRMFPCLLDHDYDLQAAKDAAQFQGISKVSPAPASMPDA